MEKLGEGSREAVATIPVGVAQLALVILQETVTSLTAPIAAGTENYSVGSR